MYKTIIYLSRVMVVACLSLLVLAGSTKANNNAQQASGSQRAKSPSGQTPAKGIPGKDIEGIWQGALSISAVELRLALKVSKGADGGYSATIDSIDQNAKDIPVDATTLIDSALHLELKRIGASYDGLVNSDKSAIAGEWKQGGLTLPLTFRRTEKVAELIRPQEPKKPYPYDEEEVVYENKQGGVKLAGTLTKPRSGGPHPAVLLITGSGAQDRNESLLGHKPFLVLADYLTRQGIAVLRVDDRGVGGSTGNIMNSTDEDFAADALAGVSYLKSRTDINPKKIGLLGHSEGGLVAPIAAVESPDIAFIVLMAGTGISGEEILYQQGLLIARSSGAREEILQKGFEIQKRLYAIVKAESDVAVREKKLRELFPIILAELTDEQKKVLGATTDSMEGQLKTLLSPWFRYFLAYDPRPVLMKVKCPVLAIIGERDMQVPPKSNLPEIEKALKAGGNKDYKAQEMKGLNHLFQDCVTGSPSEYGKIEETISPAALSLMGNWILEHTK